jgi:hypothetical protein
VDVLHIEGMGVVGSILAWHLHQRNQSFTWSDTDYFISAWRASTGGIYPAGDQEEFACYQRWRQWQSAPPWDVRGCVELASFWFLSKNPPHGGRYEVIGQVGPLRLGELPSLHLSAQKLVEGTRIAFAGQRRESEPSGASTVVSHGFGPRLHHVSWGWHVPVELAISPSIREYTGSRRSCFYLRTDRFTMAYAYPTPGTSTHYAGSSTIRQKDPHTADPMPHFQKWADRLVERTQGRVQVSRYGKPVQGWRPVPDKADTAIVREIGGKLHVRPMSANGVRLAPLYVDAVLERL